VVISATTSKLHKVLSMKNCQAKRIKIYHKVPKPPPVMPTILKISAKNVITDLKIKVSIIKDLRIFMVRGVLPPHIYLSGFK